jgi:hypothetical protein
MDALSVEGEVDGGAAVDDAVGPGPAAMAVDDAPDGGQADAGAGELGGVVEPLERLISAWVTCDRCSRSSSRVAIRAQPAWTRPAYSRPVSSSRSP